MKNHSRKFQTERVAKKEDIFDFPFCAFMTGSELSSVMGPVSIAIWLGKHRSRFLTHWMHSTYHRKWFLKVTDQKHGSERRYIRFYMFAFIARSEPSSVMGPVSGGMRVWNHGSRCLTYLRPLKYHNKAFLKVSDQKHGSERRNIRFYIFRFYKTEWTQQRYGTCFWWYVGLESR